ncbi:hypothetical protein [Wolbachia endosymbiont (group A) of Agelastica alni]
MSVTARFFRLLCNKARWNPEKFACKQANLFGEYKIYVTPPRHL